MGLLIYTQDCDNTLPLACFGPDPEPSDGNARYKWMDVVFPYIKNTSYFHCLSDTADSIYQFRSGRNYGSYVLNNAYFAPGDRQTPPAGLRLEKISLACCTVLVTDGEGDFQFAWPDALHTPPLTGDDPFHLDSIRGRHGPGLNGTAPALACDGSCSTANLHFARKTAIINGQRIYTALTVEDD